MAKSSASTRKGVHMHATVHIDQCRSMILKNGNIGNCQSCPQHARTETLLPTARATCQAPWRLCASHHRQNMKTRVATFAESLSFDSDCGLYAFAEVQGADRQPLPCSTLRGCLQRSASPGFAEHEHGSRLLELDGTRQDAGRKLSCKQVQVALRASANSKASCSELCVSGSV